MLRLLRFIIHWYAIAIVLALTLIGVAAEKVGFKKLDDWATGHHFNWMQVVWASGDDD